MTTQTSYSGIPCRPFQPKLTEVKIRRDGDNYIVEPYFHGLERPCTGGYSCGSKQLAIRLNNAIVDGVVLTNIEFEHDADGKSFASYDFNIRMRCANADLKRLGY